MSSKDNSNEEMENFDWITLKNDMDAIAPVETQREKFIRKFKSNPFVPIGCLATTLALTYGLWCFRTGQKKMSQYMMRTRIAAQGLTVLALVTGIGLSAQKANKKDQ
ncbi:HIG1 domain family member 2A [Diorhabda carinulata]|uniref:HIG1 domain family member 2A n=1 Tax=Diorhabda sublineata TaxID=1163346 RepID=UPI0024E14446|nr:HIG1 domain family member 2A [Diorhabda sublineata]XP_057651870.1 HIG1 domain family member 2A [Diorhabda carinulata]